MTKSNRPIIRIHNLETNEILDRAMNDDEFAKYQEDQSEILQAQAEAQAQAIARTELLAKLGITAEEAALLLS